MAASNISEASTSKFACIKLDDRDVNIHYNDIGSGDETIVMLHGSGAGASGWANYYLNVEPFAAAGYRVILMDFPGWGKSDSIISTGVRSDLNARALKALVDTLNLKRIHLVGNSMGGHSSVSFTLAHPDQVGKLILMGGGTGGPSLYAPMPTEGIKLLNSVYREPTIEKLKQMLNVFVYDASSITEELMQQRLNNVLERRDHLENFVKSFELNPKQYADYSPRLSEITAPTLVVWGRDDRFVAMDVGLKLIAGISNAQMHIFNHCGHWAQWEHADEFNRMVLDFLKH
jgi:2-hydroxy-6-oxonona-2,4-dienedioate hydrolase